MRGVERPAYQPMKDVRRSSTLAAVRQRQEQEAARAAARRNRIRVALVPGVLLIAGIGAGVWWWSHHQGVPGGIVRAEGRLELPEIPVTLPFAGTLGTIVVNEGDMVAAGQVLATLDVSGAQAELERVTATIEEAKRALETAQADVAQRRGQAQAAEQEVRAAMAHGTRQALDQRRAAKDTLIAGLAKAVAAQTATDETLASARDQMEKLKTQVAQDKLSAPRAGRVSYRFAEPGETLAAGAPVLTLIDPGEIYVRLTVPTDQAAKAATGDEARITIGGDAKLVADGTVTYVAPAGAADADDKVKSKDPARPVGMKIKVNEAILRGPPQSLHTGAPAIGYIRIDPAAAWPGFLQPHA